VDFKPELCIDILSLYAPGPYADINDVTANNIRCISETVTNLWDLTAWGKLALHHWDILERYRRKACLLFYVPVSLGATSFQSTSSFGLLSTCFWTSATTRWTRTM